MPGWKFLAISVQPPVASFVANIVHGARSLQVRFKDLSTNIPTSWDWNFGDSTPHSNDQHPVHTFTLSGSFDITLQVENGGGQSTLTKNKYIVIEQGVGFKLSGTVLEKGSPVERIVRAYHRETGAFVKETLSDSIDGSFEMILDNDDEHYVIAFDDITLSPDYNALIQDRLTPEAV